MLLSRAICHIEIVLLCSPPVLRDTVAVLLLSSSCDCRQSLKASMLDGAKNSISMPIVIPRALPLEIDTRRASSRCSNSIAPVMLATVSVAVSIAVVSVSADNSSSMASRCAVSSAIRCCVASILSSTALISLVLLPPLIID